MKSKLGHKYITLLILTSIITYSIHCFKPNTPFDIVITTESNEINTLIKNSTYIFILTPPYQGSTILYELVASSETTTSFLPYKDIWQGEGQGVLKKCFNEKDYKQYNVNRWNPNFALNMTNVKYCFDLYWNLSKNIFVEKSPPNLVRAKLFEDYFSNFGTVYFLISNRNPYAWRGKNSSHWVEMAKYQKQNIEILKNTFVTNYEQLCKNTTFVAKQIMKAIPNLGELYPITHGSGRHGEIDVRKVDRLINTKEKNIVLRKHQDLMDYFAYKIMNDTQINSRIDMFHRMK